MGETGTSAKYISDMTTLVLQGTSHITSLNLRGLCLAHSSSCCGLPWPKGKRGQTLRIFLTLALSMGTKWAQPTQ